MEGKRVAIWGKKAIVVVQKGETKEKRWLKRHLESAGGGGSKADK